MIIKNLYQTKIECINETTALPQYEINYDDYIQVRVTLLDFNGEPVTGKEVVLRVDKGRLLPRSSSDEKISTGSTDDNGVYVARYKASEFGLVTFRVNDKSVKINVTGKIRVKEDGGFKCSVVNNEYGLLEFDGTLSDCTTDLWETVLSAFIPLEYAPKSAISTVVLYDNLANINSRPLCMIGVRLDEESNKCVILKKCLHNPTNNETVSVTGQASLFWKLNVE